MKEESKRSKNRSGKTWDYGNTELSMNYYVIHAVVSSRWLSC